MNVNAENFKQNHNYQKENDIRKNFGNCGGQTQLHYKKISGTFPKNVTQSECENYGSDFGQKAEKSFNKTVNCQGESQYQKYSIKNIHTKKAMPNCIHNR